MNARGCISIVLFVAAIAAALIITGVAEGWTGWETRELWWPVYALLVVGVIYWVTGRRRR